MPLATALEVARIQHRHKLRIAQMCMAAGLCSRVSPCTNCERAELSATALIRLLLTCYMHAVLTPLPCRLPRGSRQEIPYTHRKHAVLLPIGAERQMGEATFQQVHSFSC